MRAVQSLLLALLATAGCGAKKENRPAPLAQEVLSSTGPARVASAQKLLAEAGYPGGKGFPRLEILYNTLEAHKKIAAAIQQMWRKNLGIEVELRNTEWKVYLDDMSKRRYQIIRRGWIGDYRDPNTFIEMMTSASGNNNTGWSDPEYDRRVKAAAAQTDPARRLESLRAAEKILLRDVPVMPIYFYRTTNCWKGHVQGMHSNIQDIHPLNEVHSEARDALVVNNGTEVQTLDPALARGVPEHRILIGLFEGLVNYDPKTLDPRPGAAERWEVSPDGKNYTFHLREAEWSDGQKVTARDFEYAWKRVLNPSTPTDYAHQMYYLKGAEDYHSQKTPDADRVGVRARDDRTLQVELENPCAFFLDLCAFFTYYPVRRDVVERHGTEWTRPGNLVGNGPYLLQERRLNDVTVLERNPRYWNVSKVRQKGIHFLAVENTATAWNLYLNDKCDWVTTLPLEQIEEIAKRPDFHGDTYLGIYYYSFNVAHGPLQDRRVRMALTLAVDRETIVTKITKQGQQPAYHFVPPAWPDYKSPRLGERD